MRLCSIVVYELRFGTERSAVPMDEHAKLDAFLRPFLSIPFDDSTARVCACIRKELEQSGLKIGPHDLQIAAIAVQHSLALVTHNTAEFQRISRLTVVDWEI